MRHSKKFNFIKILILNKRKSIKNEQLALI